MDTLIKLIKKPARASAGRIRRGLIARSLHRSLLAISRAPALLLHASLPPPCFAFLHTPCFCVAEVLFHLSNSFLKFNQCNMLLQPSFFIFFFFYIQLCDFGLARSLGKAPSAATSPGGGSSAAGVAPDVEDGDSGGEAKLTEYVVTRWWRAPEVRRVEEREWVSSLGPSSRDSVGPYCRDGSQSELSPTRRGEDGQLQHLASQYPHDHRVGRANFSRPSWVCKEITWRAHTHTQSRYFYTVLPV